MKKITGKTKVGIAKIQMTNFENKPFENQPFENQASQIRYAYCTQYVQIQGFCLQAGVHTRILLKEDFFEIHAFEIHTFEVYTVKIGKCLYPNEATASSSPKFSGSSPRMALASSPISSTGQRMVTLPLLFLPLCAYSSDTNLFK